MAVTGDPFQSFSAQLYLQEYYGDIGEENQFLLSFLHETYELWNPKVIWDIGGGPTIYQLISASRRANQIRIFEYLEENRNAVKLWQQDSPKSFDWYPYFEAVALLEKGQGAAIEARLRNVIQSIEPVNLFSESQVIDGSYDPTPDAISSHFCVESITSDPEQFEKAWSNLMSLVPSGKYLIMSLLKNARKYSAGPYDFPAFPIEEIGLDARLKKEGFREIEIRTIPAEHGRDYQGIICVRAIRQN